MVDAVVVGAGIAGLAVGAELARRRSVLVLEREPAPATQSSARSASSWIPGYGSPTSRALTLASEAWYRTGGDGHVDRSLLAWRGSLLVTRDPASPGLHEALAAGLGLLDAAQAHELYPPLREGVVASAAHDPASEDIDTPVALEAMRTKLEAAGGRLDVGTPILAIRRDGSGWTVTTGGGSVACGLVVDAAGAWGDEVAGLAGVPPVGLRAYRRTAFLFRSQVEPVADRLPFLREADEAFYIKPEAGAYLASPADATEQPPGPAVPTDAAVEQALAHVRAYTRLEPIPTGRTWAGLRTFVGDRLPVLGPDPLAPGFAWYVGLGGSGIMTAPAAARTVVALIDEGRLPGDVAGAGGRATDVVPDRLVGRA